MMEIPLIGLGSQAASATAGAVRQGGATFADMLKAARGATAPRVDPPAAHATSDQAKTLERNARALLTSFSQSLRKLLADRGVDPQSEICLEDDGGRIELTGDHLDRDKIEEVLDEHPELRERFEELAAAFRSLQAAQPGTDMGRLADRKFKLTLSGSDARPELV